MLKRQVRMNIWRLIAHHKHPEKAAQWSRRESVISIGWGGTGDLNQQHFRDAEELTPIVASTHPGSSVSNCVNGGHSLWHLYSGVQNGDLVIVSAAGRRVMTMLVTGDYYFVGDEGPDYYEHRRRAKVVAINPDHLWQLSNGMASGEHTYRTLVRCARSMSESEFNALVG